MDVFVHIIKKVDSNERPDCKFFQLQLSRVPAGFFPPAEHPVESGNRVSGRFAMRWGDRVFCGFKIKKYAREYFLRLFWSGVSGFEGWLKDQDAHPKRQIVFRKVSGDPPYECEIR